MGNNTLRSASKSLAARPLLLRPVVERVPIGPPFVFAQPIKPPLHQGTTRLHLSCLFFLAAAGYFPLHRFNVTGPGFVLHCSTWLWGSAWETLPTEWRVTDAFIEGHLRNGSILPVQFLYLFACLEFIRRILLPERGVSKKPTRLGPFRRIASLSSFGLAVAVSVPTSVMRVQALPGLTLLLFPFLVLAWYAFQEERERAKEQRLFAWSFPMLALRE